MHKMMMIRDDVSVLKTNAYVYHLAVHLDLQVGQMTLFYVFFWLVLFGSLY